MSATTGSTPDAATPATGNATTQPAPEPPTSAGDPARPPARRWRGLRLGLRAGGWLLGTLLLLVVVTTGLVLGTQTGLRATLGIVHDLAPDLLSVGAVEGRLLGRIRVVDLALRLPGLELDLGEAVLDWSPAALLTGTLRVAELRIRDISIATAPGDPDKPFTLPEIRLPVGVDLAHGQVERLRYQTIGTPPASAIVLDHLDLSATVLADALVIRALDARLSQPAVSATATGQAQLTGAWPMNLDLHWQFAPRPAVAATGADPVAVPVPASSPSPGLPPAPATSASPPVTATSALPPVTATSAPPLVTATSAPPLVTATSAPPPVTATSALPAPPPALTGTGRVRGDLNALQIEHQLTGAIDATLTATLRDALTHPAWDARIAITAVDLPALVPDAPPLDLTAELVSAGNLDAATLTGTVTAASAALADPGPLAVVLDLGWTAPVLTINRLGLRAGDTGKTRLDLTGRVDVTDPEQPGLDLSAQWAGLRWPLTGSPLVESANGQVSVKGTVDGADIRLTTEASGAQVPTTGVALTARAGRERIDLGALDLTTLGGQLTLAGSIQLTPALTWDLTLSGRDLDPGLQYPGFSGRVGLTATSQGGLTDGFGWQLRTDAAITGYPKAALAASGSGTPAAITIDTLRLETLNGRIDGTGQVTLTPQIGWDATLTATNLDPGQFNKDWPGRIGGRIVTRGQLTAEGPDLSVRIDGLGGQLRGYPVRVDGALTLADQTLVLDDFTAASGPSRLTASGRAGSTLDLRFDLNSPDLATLLPGARGALTASGRLAGTQAAPTLALTLDGRGIGLAEQGVERISGTVSAGLARNAPLVVALTASGINASGQRFDTLTLNANGSLARHRMTAALAGPALKVDIATDGALGEAGDWRGSLQRLDLAVTGYGPLALRGPVPVRLDGPRISAGPLCLDAGKGSGACIRFEQTAPGRFTATLDAPRLELALLKPLLPDTIAATGFARVTGRFTGTGGAITGSARLELPEAAATLILPGDDERLVFSGARVDLDANPRGLTARLALPLEGIGRVGGEVTLPGFPASGAQAPLRGSVTARVDSFARLAGLVPDVTHLTGTLDADLKLGGSLAAPTIGGNAALRGVGLQVPLTGTEVKDLNLTATSRGGNGFVLAGSALVGGGRVDLSGDASGLLAKDPAFAFTVRGERIKVADTREYFALVSLDINGARGPAGLAITGTIKVPEARIMPRAVAAGAILPSPDVIIIGAKESGPSLPVSIDILTRLGDKVLIDAFGLRGRLTGDLRVLKEPGGELLGDGQLSVVDGTFRVSLPGLGLVTALGAPLRIEQGIVNFARTPLTDPGLVLNAVRQGGDLTAGVQVLGTLRSPKLAFFSDTDPNMSQAEITKYLVTGIPPQRDGDKSDNGALSVGTYVAPRLFVEYENNLGGQSNRVKARYDLNNRIELQTETGGGSQGADIFFKFER